MHPYIAVPATGLLVLRAYRKKSLTPLGIIVAALTAVIHALHPWSVFFALLVVFFLGGTTVTKVKHDEKSRLTLSSGGASGGEGPRTHIQVLANSVVASVLVLLHYRQMNKKENEGCWPYGKDLLVVGIVSNYAAVAADTFSSELGILSAAKPRLITSLNFRQVPPGTNGGITIMGTVAGFAGALTIALTSAMLLPFCPKGTAMGSSFRDGWGWRQKFLWILAVTLWGGCGSLVDSALGGWLQASVVDTRTGKVIEGIGGKKVLTSSLHKHPAKDVSKATRRVESGIGLLDNNAVNFLMALIMSVGGMLAMSYAWNLPLKSLIM